MKGIEHESKREMYSMREKVVCKILRGVIGVQRTWNHVTYLGPWKYLFHYICWHLPRCSSIVFGC